MRYLFRKENAIVLIALTFTAFVFVVLSWSNDVYTQSVVYKAGATPQSTPEEKEERKLKMSVNSYQIQDEEKDLIESQKWKERIRALTESRDLSGLVHLSDEIDFFWGKKSSKLYAGLMFEVCGAMGSYDFDNDEKYEKYVLSRRCAKKALERAEQIPVEWELKLVSLLNGDIEYSLKLVPEENWRLDRRERLNHWCHAWQKLERAIDNNFDFEANRPISHPKMSAEERQKAEKYSQQRFLQQDKKSFSGQFEGFLVRAYSKPPYDAQELKSHLQSCVSEAPVRSRILEKVESRIIEGSKKN